MLKPTSGLPDARLDAALHYDRRTIIRARLLTTIFSKRSHRMLPTSATLALASPPLALDDTCVLARNPLPSLTPPSHPRLRPRCLLSLI